MNKKYLPWIIFGLALIGFALAGYTWLITQNLASSSICTFGQEFDCDIVTRGPYSKIYGISVSLIGMIGYGFMALAALLRHWFREDRGLDYFLLAAAAGGLAFSFYLTGLEAFVIHSWCLFCVSSQIIILLIFAAAVRINWLLFKK